jgi:hypothetical protein
MRKSKTSKLNYKVLIHVVVRVVQTSRAPPILMGLEAGPSIKSSKKETSFWYLGSSSNFIVVTISRKCLNGAGHKIDSTTGEVSIFFLQTRKLWLSPCSNKSSTLK